MEDIKETKEKIAAAEREGDIVRRDRLETYLIELQRKENLLLQQQLLLTPARPGIFFQAAYFIHFIYIFHLILLLYLQ